MVLGVCPGLLLLVTALSALFLFTSLGSRRCPDAGLGIGVRLVVLWVSGHTADPLVVAVLPSYFLRLIPNRLSTERKRPGLDTVLTLGWVKGFLFPQRAVTSFSVGWSHRV